MDRRDFFGATAGALILGPLFGPTVLRYHTPTRTIRLVREFTNIRLIDVSPIDAGSFRDWINDPRWMTIRKDIMASPSFTVEEDDD